MVLSFKEVEARRVVVDESRCGSNGRSLLKAEIKRIMAKKGGSKQQVVS